MIKKEDLRRRNFAPDEFFKSDAADKFGILNYPRQELAILTCLMSTADAAQEIWEVLFAEWKRKNKKYNVTDFFIKINSGYRTEKVNGLVGGSKNSQHIQGLAIDFTCPAFGAPKDIVKYLHSIKFLSDQCLEEESWVHYSRCLAIEIMKKNPNRMIFGSYLLDKKTNKRELKIL